MIKNSWRIILDRLNDLLEEEKKVRNALSCEDTRNNRDRNEKRLEELKDKIVAYRLKLKQWFDTKKQKQIFNFNNQIFVDEPKQTITIGDIVFWDFRSLFDRFKVQSKDKQTKWKWWIWIIVGIVKSHVTDLSKFNCEKLLEVYDEFKTKWDKRTFSECGNKKKAITTTDRDSINSIFKECWLTIRLEFDNTKKHLLIKH